MSATTVENVISAIRAAFTKYPEGDGGLHLDYQWVQPEQSSHVAKVILLELAANGFEIVKKGA
jgi:hypothetical protein